MSNAITDAARFLSEPLPSHHAHAAPPGGKVVEFLPAWLRANADPPRRPRRHSPIRTGG
jgi:hypothetical protein